jgi:DNA-binding XRE family transcriptional regulator
LLQADRESYVYTLDIEGCVFYVGKGCQRSNKSHRYKDHFREAKRGCTCEKCWVIRNAWSTDKKVMSHIIYSTPIEQDALIYEAATILAYFNSGIINKMILGTGSRKRRVRRVRTLHDPGSVSLVDFRTMVCMLTQNHLAEMSGICKGTISDIEIGKSCPTLATQGKILHGLSKHLGRQVDRSEIDEFASNNHE